MTAEGLRSAIGRRVVSATSAEEIGELKAVVVDQPPRRIVAVQVAGSKRKPAMVGWSDLAGFGPDAVMVGSEDAVRRTADDAETGAARGELSLLGARVLDDAGDEHGVVDDVAFDAETGALVAVTTAGAGELGSRFEAADLLGFGTYALVVRAPVGADTR
jgi:uncharacterized protein YrrD